MERSTIANAGAGAGAVGRVRRVVENGREYLVAPLSLIVPGVLAGSKGALYYPPDEIARNHTVWDGTPIVVYHPHDPLTNQPQSVWDRGVIERAGVGEVRSSRVQGGSGVLRAEGWFDSVRTREVDPRVHEALVKGRHIELSTGLYTDNHSAPPGSVYATPRGPRGYDYIARNYRPDHVAILPDQVGACSVKDGCGVFNRSGSDNHSDGPSDDPCTCSTTTNQDEPMGLMERFVSWLTGNVGVTERVADGAVGDAGKVVEPAQNTTSNGTDYEAIEAEEGTTDNGFCPTGKGGGSDNSCPSRKGAGGGGGAAAAPTARLANPAPAPKPAPRQVSAATKSAIKQTSFARDKSEKAQSGSMVDHAVAAHAHQVAKASHVLAAAIARGRGDHKLAAKHIDQAEEHGEHADWHDKRSSLWGKFKGLFSRNEADDPSTTNTGDGKPGFDSEEQQQAFFGLKKASDESESKKEGGGKAEGGKGETVHPAVERALSRMTHVTRSDQAEQQGRDHYQNDGQARKDFKDHKEFGKAVRAEYEKRQGGGKVEGSTAESANHHEKIELRNNPSEIDIHKGFMEAKKRSREVAKDYLDQVDRKKGGMALRSLAMDHGVPIGKNPGGKGTDLAWSGEIIKRMLDKTHGKGTTNAGINQPRHGDSGQYLPHGAGTGKGPAHKAATRGGITGRVTMRQVSLGHDALKQLQTTGHNPASWVQDEDKWEKAKEQADKGDYDKESGQYWAVVTHIYENMGGEIKEDKSGKGSGKSTTNSDDATEPADTSTANAKYATHDGRPCDPDEDEDCEEVTNMGSRISNKGSGFKSEAQRDAFFDTIKKSGEYDPEEAGESEKSVGSKLSDKAVSKSSAVSAFSGKADDAKGHQEAARAHDNARLFHERQGNTKLASSHGAAANYHHHMAEELQGRTERWKAEEKRSSGGGKTTGKKLSGGTENMANLPREELLDYISLNCDCSDDDRAALNGLSDTVLGRIANATSMGKAQGSNATTATGRGSTPSLEEQTDDGDMDGDEAQTDDDMTQEARGGSRDDRSKMKNNRYTSNSRRRTVTLDHNGRMPLDDFMEIAPEQVHNLLSNAMQVEQQARTRLVKGLTEHLADGPQKRSVVNRLKGKTIDELQDLALIQPAGNRQRMQLPQELSYLGAAAPLFNGGRTQADRDDYLALPTMNWGKDEDS